MNNGDKLHFILEIVAFLYQSKTTQKTMNPTQFSNGNQASEPAQQETGVSTTEIPTVTETTNTQVEDGGLDS